MIAVLTLIFLAAIPLNVWVAAEIHRAAWPQPRIDLLVAFSRIVTALAIVTTVLGLLSVNAVVFLTTGLRLIPSPIPTVLLVGALLLASTANVLVWRYLRKQKQL